VSVGKAKSQLYQFQGNSAIGRNRIKHIGYGRRRFILDIDVEARVVVCMYIAYFKDSSGKV
jgi:hypothetical protein